MFWKLLERFWDLPPILRLNVYAVPIYTYMYGTDQLLDIYDSVTEINAQFANIGTRIAVELQKATWKPLDINEGFVMTLFADMTVETFLEYASEVKCSKSSGIERLNSRVMIDAMLIIPHVL